MKNEANILAVGNLADLMKNTYPGRGFILGTDETGHYVVMIYWIMGRSASSRNRLFMTDDRGGLRTELADPSVGGDISLIVYPAMMESGRFFAVSNGNQTELALSCAREQVGMTAPSFKKKFKYEPDAPNFTPRITGTVTINKGNYVKDKYGIYVADISILQRSALGDECDLHVHRYDTIAPGFGYCVTTYTGDGSPLPSFEANPYLMPLKGDMKTITQTYWDTLNEDNKVSLAVKFIDLKTHKSTLEVLNKYESVLAEK